MKEIIPFNHLKRRIYLIRGHRVMLDLDLAELYGVRTKALNQAVKRQRKRFPEDFMFRLSKTEFQNWRSQFVTSNPSARMGLRRPPYAFTEQGVAMLSSVLNSGLAVQVNIAIMRTFVKIRQAIGFQAEVLQRLKDLENRVVDHDANIAEIFDAIRQLMEPTEKPKTKIGFRVEG